MGNLSGKIKIGHGNTVQLSNADVRKILSDQLKQANKVIMNDKDYISVDENRLKEFARKDGTNNLRYKSERSDCDDFTRVFLGRVSENVFKHGSNGNRALAIGEVQGTIYKDDKPVNHSMVIYITKGKVKFFEPQNDKIYNPDPRNEYWFIHL